MAAIVQAIDRRVGKPAPFNVPWHDLRIFPGIIEPDADLLLRMNKEQTQHEVWPVHRPTNI